MPSENTTAKFYRNGEEPVFAAPWEAHAFAITVKLYEKGMFSWSEWSESLAESIRANPEAPYYQSWLNALEALVLKKGIVIEKELLEKVESFESDH